MASALKTVALFKGSPKAAPKKAVTKPAPKKSGGASKSGGWLGSGSKSVNLSKW